MVKRLFTAFSGSRCYARAARLKTIRQTQLILRHARDEKGGATLLCLTWISFFMILAGVAIDSTNAYRVKGMMQNSADAAAVSAAADLPDSSAAKLAAVSYAESNLPTVYNGEVLSANDVQVGIWDADARVFTEGGAVEDLDAVRVVLRRTAANNNSVATTFLRLLNYDSWDVENLAVAQRFVPRCLNDGLIAAGMVDMSSNNTFGGNLCIHGQAGVDMQNNNAWNDTTIVSAPSLEMISTPSGDMSSNPGLEERRAEQSMQVKMVQRLDEDLANMLDPNWEYMPSFMDPSKGFEEIQDRKIDFTTMEQGKLYLITAPCKKGTIKTTGGGGNGNGNGGGGGGASDGDETLYASDGSVIRNIALVSECPVNIGSNTVLENVLIASYGADLPSETRIHMSAGVQLGADDDCAPGGGVQIFTDGSITSAANLSIFGSQIVAAGDVSIAAQAEGVRGVSVQAGGDIRVTANNSFGTCSGGVDNIVTTRYYRIVQ